jgi:hypothetical protein
MVKRIYNLTKQERDYFCIPAVIQAVLRRREIEESQVAIAAEIGCREGSAVKFGENLADFFEKRALDFTYYNFNELPTDDPYYITSYCFENDSDMMIGYGRTNHLHIRLATSFSNPNITLLDPDTCIEGEIDIDDVVEKMRDVKSGGFGLVEKLQKL